MHRQATTEQSTCVWSRRISVERSRWRTARSIRGGTAEPHDHETEHQIIYVLEGRCDVGLGDAPVVECGPGTVIEIPPKVMHSVVAKGEAPLKVLVIYSPPLPPRDDIAVG